MEKDARAQIRGYVCSLSWDEARGKPVVVGAYVSQHLTLLPWGRPLEDSQGQNRTREIRLSRDRRGAS